MMAENWSIKFSIEADGFAYVTVAHGSETQKHRLGPAGEAVASAMAWVAEDDAQETFCNLTTSTVVEFFSERGKAQSELGPAR